ncbi:HdeD family acid-resistance protein [Pararhodobacter aggregans]|uniref:HdeD family acid-resistance protein n=1 Tax=Pararhodobacter aggregans TaxID=404875 RepID=UPI003A9405E1
MRPASVLLIVGVVLVIGGVLALANPFAASLAVTTLVGMVLIVAGVLQSWVAITGAGVPHRIWTGFVGLLGLLAGVSLIANPLAGVVSLTLLVGIVFLLTGAVRLGMAWRLRETPLFWFLLLSGAASVLIGFLVVTDIGAAATSLLGLLLGIQLLADGIGLIALGLIARRS